jgi:hypothetical protein
MAERRPSQALREIRANREEMVEAEEELYLERLA